MPDDSKWISVKDRLPDQFQEFLVHCPPSPGANPLIAVAWFHPDRGVWRLSGWPVNPSHWMELPEAPVPAPASQHATLTELAREVIRSRTVSYIYPNARNAWIAVSSADLLRLERAIARPDLGPIAEDGR